MVENGFFGCKNPYPNFPVIFGRCNLGIACNFFYKKFRGKGQVVCPIKREKKLNRPRRVGCSKPACLDLFFNWFFSPI